ncbi:FHA domain-containing protein [Paenibacillus nanensis]|uniref:FHA domain-containing protein n=1 Tax=Paenibacillus nanensis TaxID=393251 RepID=A0A3A1V5C7_9BACL|nr:DUF6382 domain-containing protein [Paenibacillus nanensis]RIX52750.1 FHA domain-containing protein [Paenibacillus nanensis]
MRQFRIDFAMNNRHEMIVDSEKGIFRHELDELELQMLRSQTVPYLLPIEWSEIDGIVTFRYALTGMRMLVHRLQQEPITMEQYYGLLLSVTDALLECKDYMLRPESCMLNDQFIFTGERMDDIRFVYLPLKEADGIGLQPVDGLLQLAVRWTTYIDTIDGEGLKRIVQSLGQSRSPLNNLRETLLELIANGHGGGAASLCEIASRPKEQPFASQPYAGLVDKPEQHVLRQSISEAGKERNGLPLNIVLMNDAEQSNGGELLHDADEPEQGARRRQGKWMMIAAWALGAACVWRFLYMSEPSRSNLLICAALTLLLTGGLYYAWTKIGSLFIREKASEDDREWMEPLSGPLDPDPPKAKAAWKWSSEPVMPEYELPLSSTTSSMGNYSIPPSASQPSQQGARKRLEPTTVISETENKAVQAGEINEAHARQPWLSRVWNGQEEKIEIDADSFKIGRSIDGAGYSEDAEGVSRLHLEIERVNGEHHAKDLGSRNGSLLNGKLMVPYKAYKLEAGDRIHLAGDKGPLYELRTG